MPSALKSSDTYRDFLSTNGSLYQGFEQLIVTIHQPDFLPWLGFFYRWAKSDLYVVLDDVQFVRRGWHHRDRIKTRQGARWLTVSVEKKGKYTQQIKDVIIDRSSKWKHKHLKTIEAAYAQAPFFDEHIKNLKSIYDKDHEKLIDLNMDLLDYAASRLGITTPIVFSSSFGLESSKTQRLLDILRLTGGNVYLTGTGSTAYLKEEIFQDQGIRIWWQKDQMPVYQQLHGGFIEKLSIIDYLMMKSSMSWVSRDTVNPAILPRA
jgi:hypothetical protein